jgi:hydrogenase nickel incorporation protein HypA/HybF
MHELAVTKSILEIALQHAATAQAQRITGLYLVIGQLSTIVDDSVQFYWEIISEETIAAGSQLHFRRVQTKLLCIDCNYTYTPGNEELACPLCGGIHVKILSGEEFSLEAIDVET